MAPGKALAELALQKRFLRAEADAQRLCLASELEHALTPLRRIEQLQSQLRPLLLFGAPIAGLLFTRRTKGPAKWLAAGVGVARLIFSIRRILRCPGAAR
jgi:hypothetical protein